MILLLILSTIANASQDCASVALEPERFAPFACAKMVEFNKDWILKEISEGHSVHCEMGDYGPVIHYNHGDGEAFHGCPYAVFLKLIQTCPDVKGKIPSWAKEKKHI